VKEGGKKWGANVEIRAERREGGRKKEEEEVGDQGWGVEFKD
jgi:hypothetical protein